MKKVKFIFCFLLIFLFFKSDNVYAAQELTCIYEGSISSDSIMLTQNSKGQIAVYANPEKDKPGISDINWYNVDEAFSKTNYQFETKTYNANTKTLTDCPKYTRSNKDNTSYNYYFYDDKSFIFDNNALYKKATELPDSNNFYRYYNKVDNNEIKSTKWIGTCHYEDEHYSNITLYFNREKMILSTENQAQVKKNIPQTGFTLYELLEYYETTGICPTIYRKADSIMVDNIFNNVNTMAYYLTVKNNSFELIPTKNSVINDEREESEEVIEEIESCTDLFSQNFINKLNSYLTIIRFFIPILLIVFGGLDFIKAIFSSSEDEMKKAQSKFIKRIIAAILVFLIPTLVNFILEIANSVWNYIDPNSCNIG